MLKQGLQQKLLQKLSPQQIQFIKLLQIPTAALEARIKQELEENPALTEGSDEEPLTVLEAEVNGNFGDQAETKTETKAEAEEAGNELEGVDGQEVSLEEYIDQEEDYRYKESLAADPNAERYEAPVVQLNSLYDLLMSQIQMFSLNETELAIAQQIIGSIDEDGYFRRPLSAIVDDLAFRNSLVIEEEEVERVLYKVQQLDPAGVGARDLQECLLLQLDRQPHTDEVLLAQRILMDFFEEFTKKHFDRIIERTGVERDTFKEAYTCITHLNPKPGEGQTEVKAGYIMPDFILTVSEGEIDIKLNRRNAPELHINKNYTKMLARMEQEGKRGSRETLQFVKAKIDSAKWFIDAIRQRQMTLLRTMAAIANKQKDFFLSEGDPSTLRPMILKDIAEEVGMDISTISRVANSKYVQTDFGIYQLKHFFSEGITTDSGEEVSNKEVKAILKGYIDAEEKNKPLSDDRLAELLNEKGYNIARRTVAKYREQLNIPVARLRKEV